MVVAPSDARDCSVGAELPPVPRASPEPPFAKGVLATIDWQPPLSEPAPPLKEDKGTNLLAMLGEALGSVGGSFSGAPDPRPRPAGDHDLPEWLPFGCEGG